jgi:hypothetical protein
MLRYGLAVSLVGGTLAMGVGAVLHPMLPVDLAQQLEIMGSTPGWAAIHVLMLLGSVAVMVGIWVRVLDAPRRTRVAWVLALLTIMVGLVCNASNIAFMAGDGTADAARFFQGDAGVLTRFASSHGVSLMVALTGNTLVAIGCLVAAYLEWRDDTRPRWIALLALIAGIGGLLGVLVFDPASRGAVAAVALLSGWSLGTAWLAVRRGSPVHAVARLERRDV